MSDKNILLAGIWIVVMLIYLLGDVLRIFAGDVTAGQMSDGTSLTQVTMLFIACLMVIPILMIFFSLVAPWTINRWGNIIIAIGFILFNLYGLPSFPGWYDRFLLIVSMIFSGFTIWTAWNWK